MQTLVALVVLFAVAVEALICGTEPNARLTACIGKDAGSNCCFDKNSYIVTDCCTNSTNSLMCGMPLGQGSACPGSGPSSPNSIPALAAQAGAPVLQQCTFNRETEGQNNCSNLTSECRPWCDFYEATSGWSWNNNSGWGDGALCSSADKSDWSGIGCNGYIPRRLIMVDNNLEGSLPSSMSSLTGLKTIEISQDNGLFEGTIPKELGQLTSLRTMVVWTGGSAMSGTLPAEFSSMSSLRVFWMGGLSISGTVPTEWGLWNDMQIFVLQNIPELTMDPICLDGWSNLLAVAAEGVHLSGTLPNNASLELLEVFSFANRVGANSGISGTVPDELLIRMQKLRMFNVGHNRLSGTLGDQFRDLKFVTGLIMHGQRLSGTLPLLNASGLAVLSLARNSISGDTSGLSGVDDSALRTLLLMGNYFCCQAYELNSASNLAKGVLNPHANMNRVLDAAKDSNDLSTEFLDVHMLDDAVSNVALTFSGNWELYESSGTFDGEETVSQITLQDAIREGSMLMWSSYDRFKTLAYLVFPVMFLFHTFTVLLAVKTEMDDQGEAVRSAELQNDVTAEQTDTNANSHCSEDREIEAEFHSQGSKDVDELSSSSEAEENQSQLFRATHNHSESEMASAAIETEMDLSIDTLALGNQCDRTCGLTDTCSPEVPGEPHVSAMPGEPHVSAIPTTRRHADNTAHVSTAELSTMRPQGNSDDHIVAPGSPGSPRSQPKRLLDAVLYDMGVDNTSPTYFQRRSRSSLEEPEVHRSFLQRLRSYYRSPLRHCACSHKYAYDIKLLPLSRMQKLSMRKMSIWLFFAGILGMLLMSFSQHIYQNHCIDPMFETTLGVVKLDGVFEGLWLTLICVVQSIYTVYLTQFDLYNAKRKRQVSTAVSVLGELAHGTQRGKAVRQWHQNMQEYNGANHSPNTRKCRNDGAKNIDWLVFGFMYLAMVLLLSAPEVGFVIASNTPRGSDYYNLFGSAFLLVLVRFFLQALLPFLTDFQCKWKWKNARLCEHEKRRFHNRDMLASMILVTWISTLVVPVVSTVVLDEACLRYYQIFDAELVDRLSYWELDMDGFDAYRAGHCSRRVISLYSYIFINTVLVQAFGVPAVWLLEEHAWTIALRKWSTKTTLALMRQCCGSEQCCGGTMRPFERDMVTELQLDMTQCIIGQASILSFGAFMPILWVMHGIYVYFPLCATLWASSYQQRGCTRMIVQDVMVMQPMLPVILISTLGAATVVALVLVDYEFSRAAIISYSIFCVFQCAFMVYWMVIARQPISSHKDTMEVIARMSDIGAHNHASTGSPMRPMFVDQVNINDGSCDNSEDEPLPKAQIAITRSPAGSEWNDDNWFEK